VLKYAAAAPVLVAAAVRVPRATAANIAGMSVFLDPGHNGVADASINRQVPNGRDGTKPCNTSGTGANDGYPEHAFTWAVTTMVAGNLEGLGVHTQLSRGDDSSVGPCIDDRAAHANAMQPHAIVSIHADGGPASGHGFHVNYSSPPLRPSQEGPSIQLANAMRSALIAAGFQPANYIGSDGLYGRADLAGLNFAEYPAVLVELGNMKNAEDAAQMESAEGRARYANAVTQGIVGYLQATPG
jgi:N-acetylmuramoyl-L-alanine amidase